MQEIISKHQRGVEERRTPTFTCCRMLLSVLYSCSGSRASLLERKGTQGLACAPCRVTPTQLICTETEDQNYFCMFYEK